MHVARSFDQVLSIFAGAKAVAVDIPSRAMCYPKKGKEGKGFKERRELLEHVISSQVVTDLLQSFPRHGAHPDDILDASVAAYTAKCYADGEFERIPNTPIFDSRSLRMEMIFPS
jgi:predicted RNase H-like nuclease